MKMNPSSPPIAMAVRAMALLMAMWPAAHAGKAHEHGVAKVDVAIEGSKLTVALQSPLDSLLGFERAPRTDAERKAAADMLARLRSGGALFKADAAAQCTLSKAEVTAPVLDAANKAPVTGAAAKATVTGAAAKATDTGAAAKATVTGAAAKATEGDHADLDASYEYTCAQPQQLRTLELGLFDAFKRMQRIEVQVAGAQGQSKVTLKRPARTVKLVR